MERIGQNLKIIREYYLLLSRKELAKKVGVTLRTIYNWEKRDLIKNRKALRLFEVIYKHTDHFPDPLNGTILLDNETFYHLPELKFK